MIKVENIHKNLEGVEVLKGASINIDKGEMIALVGQSGSGKSVLLKHVTGLMKPDQGKIFIDDKDISQLNKKEIREIRDRLGFLFQGGALFNSMTIFENVAFPLKEKTGLREKEIRKRVESELEQVGLIGAEKKYPSQLSGGMIKRAALARALVEEPEIMLFDEPTTGLDPIIGKSILQLISECHKRGNFTCMLVTHEIPKVFRIVDRVALLDEGVIAFDGTPDEFEVSENPIARDFVS